LVKAKRIINLTWTRVENRDSFQPFCIRHIPLKKLFAMKPHGAIGNPEAESTASGEHGAVGSCVPPLSCE
jgi:hypothetical protein